MGKNLMESALEKIKSNDSYFIIFYDEDCGFSQRAIKLLELNGKNFKGYLINKIGSLHDFLNFLKLHKELKIDDSHKTKPIIFLNGKFIGGYTELEDYFSKIN